MVANRLKHISECKGKIRDVLSDEEILSLAKDNLIPHYVILNPLTKEESIWFMSGELNDWFDANYISQRGGHFEQKYTFVFFDKDTHKATDEVPEELRHIRNLFEIPKAVVLTPPGVYFLCQDNEIVYIGQAINVCGRITTHISEGLKDFNKVFYISCQRNRLNDLELALIRRYKPKYNKTGLGQLTEENLRTIESIINT